MRVNHSLVALSLAVSASAPASTVSGGWFEGRWGCTLDGRPTRMEWRIISVNSGGNNGDGTASNVAGAEMRGRLWDRDGPWRSLTRISSNQSEIRFRHQDGNLWYLRSGPPGQAQGHSTWQGKRYPFTCAKMG